MSIFFKLWLLIWNCEIYKTLETVLTYQFRAWHRSYYMWLQMCKMLLRFIYFYTCLEYIFLYVKANNNVVQDLKKPNILQTESSQDFLSIQKDSYRLFLHEQLSVNSSIFTASITNDKLSEDICSLLSLTPCGDHFMHYTAYNFLAITWLWMWLFMY